MRSIMPSPMMPSEILLDSGPEPTPEDVIDSANPVFFSGMARAITLKPMIEAATAAA
jgi:hypothetical protein